MTNIKNIILTAENSCSEHIYVLLKSFIAFNRYNTHVYILNSIKDPKWFNDIQISLNEYTNLHLHNKYIDIEERKIIEKNDNPQVYALRYYSAKLGLTGKALYLNLDSIFVGCIEDLFEIDLEDKAFAACIDFYINSRTFYSSHYYNKRLDKRLTKFKWNFNYFNSAVMLLNCNFISKPEFYEEKWFKDLNLIYTFSHKNQDFLNYIHYNDFKRLPCKYNYFASHLRIVKNVGEYFKWDEVDKKDKYPTLIPSILTFTGSLNPWDKFDVYNKYNQFYDIYKLFKECSSDEILSKSPEEWTKYIINWYKEQNFYIFLTDYLKDVRNKNRIQIIHKLNFGKAWSYNPSLLNYKTFTMFNFKIAKYKIAKFFNRIK